MPVRQAIDVSLSTKIVLISVSASMGSMRGVHGLSALGELAARHADPLVLLLDQLAPAGVGAPIPLALGGGAELPVRGRMKGDRGGDWLVLVRLSHTALPASQVGV